MHTIGLTTRDTSARSQPEPAAAGIGTRSSVLIAGGGVAALEAVLALNGFGDRHLEIEMICPNRQFTLRALSVAEPFGAAEPRTLDIEEFAREQGVRLRRDTVAEIWGDQQRVLTGAGEEIFYDALLLTLGARQRDALPGARPFRGAHDVGWYSDLLGRLESGAIERLVFVVPTEVRWSLPLYELALMTAHQLRERGRGNAQLAFVTHEPAPLEVFGAEVSTRVTRLLEEQGIDVHAGRSPATISGNELVCLDGWSLSAPYAISLPGLVVPDLPGLPQGRRGFIACDAEMRVDGLRSVWVAGDATWFPIKQGGVAAQQAEVATSGIAAAAGLGAESKPFQPVVRAALLTGGEPHFLRAAAGGGRAAMSTSPLWWPPGKVAGPRLAPHLARAWGEGRDFEPVEQLRDMGAGEGIERAEAEHRDAVGLAFRYADVDARERRFDDAVRWLDVAEKLNVTLPPEYADKRQSWQQELSQ